MYLCMICVIRSVFIVRYYETTFTITQHYIEMIVVFTIIYKINKDIHSHTNGNCNQIQSEVDLNYT